MKVFETLRKYGLIFVKLTIANRANELFDANFVFFIRFGRFTELPCEITSLFKLNSCKIHLIWIIFVCTRRFSANFHIQPYYDYFITFFFHLCVIEFQPLDEKYTQTNHWLLLLMFCLLDCEMFCRILHEKFVWRLYCCHKACTSGWLLVRKMRTPSLQIIYTHQIFFWETNQQKRIHNNQNNKNSTLIEDFFSVFFNFKRVLRCE